MTFPEDAEFICVYGWSESLYEKALSDHRPFAFISNVDCISKDPRIQIYHLESPLQIEPFAKKIGWSAVFKQMATIAAEPLSSAEDEWAEFKKILASSHLAASFLLSESADYEVSTLQNGRANRTSHRRGLDLKGAFTNIPAIIVGAGPSLKKNGHLIREFEKKALIFAGGSALNIIDVEPHFAASIDKDAPYKQFKMHPFSQTPFCYQGRMNPENFSLLQGERILFPDSFSKSLNWIHGHGSFESGWTVGTFLTAIARYMGCSPIIFVGMDFCYEEGQKYAHLDTQGGDKLVQVGPFLTQNDWLMAAEWMEGKGVNATEGGMLNGPKETLASLLGKCSTKWNLREMVHNAIQALPIHTGTSRWRQWDLSMKRCQKKIEEDEIVYQHLLLPLWQIWKPLFEREAVGQDMNLHKQLFFQKILEEHGSLL